MASLHPLPQPANSPAGLRFRLDQGLDSVTRQDAPPHQLPDGRATPAPDVRSQAALERLLAAPGLDSLVDAAIRPTVDDPSLLLPGRFADALRHAQASLRRNLSSRQQETSRRQRRLQRGIQVLEEQEDLLALLWTYRNALYAG